MKLKEEAGPPTEKKAGFRKLNDSPAIKKGKVTIPIFLPLPASDFKSMVKVDFRCINSGQPGIYSQIKHLKYSAKQVHIIPVLNEVRQGRSVNSPACQNRLHYLGIKKFRFFP